MARVRQGGNCLWRQVYRHRHHGEPDQVAGLPDQVHHLLVAGLGHVVAVDEVGDGDSSESDNNLDDENDEQDQDGTGDEGGQTDEESVDEEHDNYEEDAEESNVINFKEPILTEEVIQELKIQEGVLELMEL